ncbi:DUF4190 domain-containing protein [Kitasatospora azatica]|uniref:DUF4190 domain-containing protein n=1 Tax=Kitasatospora azatica TaxID=58347 RepID=UPI00068F5927|nr:DUF4190 domain-containing protein [Kitasatospora azatica]
MTDAERPEDGGATRAPQDAVPQDEVQDAVPQDVPQQAVQDAVPQDARPANPWAAPGAPGDDSVPIGYPYPHAHGPAGYGYPQPGYPHRYGPVDQRPMVAGTNGLAITSLVTGLTCCLWPAALGFGIAALVQLRRRRQGGLGLAVAGVLLGVLGLIAGVVQVVSDDFLDVSAAPRSRPSLPALPWPSGLPTTPPSLSGLTQVQQDFVDAMTELDLQNRVLEIPVDDRGMAFEESTRTAQVLVDTEVQLDKRQWPSEVQGTIATLVSSLEADKAVWRAAANDTADPVAAYHNALRTNAPSIAENLARTALGLTENNRPATPSSTPVPGATDSAPAGSV